MGGEASTFNRIKKTILNMCKSQVEYLSDVNSYIDDNEIEKMYLSSDVIKKVHSAYSDVIPFVLYANDRKKLLSTLNYLTYRYNALSTGWYFENIRKPIVRNMKEVKKQLSEISNNLTKCYSNAKIVDIANKAGYILAMSKMILELLKEKDDVLNGYIAASEVSYLLEIMLTSDNDHVRRSAQDIIDKLKVDSDWYKMESFYVEIIAKNGLELVVPIIFSVKGIVADFVSLLGGVIIGKSLEADIENAINVDCAYAIKSGIYSNHLTRKMGSDGSNYMIVSNDEEYCIRYNAWISALLYCQEKYLLFLEDYGFHLPAYLFFDINENTYKETYEDILKLRSYCGYSWEKI